MEQTGSFRAAVPLSVLTAVLGQCITSGSAMPARLLLLQGFPMALGIGLLSACLVPAEGEEELRSETGIRPRLLCLLLSVWFAAELWETLWQAQQVCREQFSSMAVLGVLPLLLWAGWQLKPDVFSRSAGVLWWALALAGLACVGSLHGQLHWENLFPAAEPTGNLRFPLYAESIAWPLLFGKRGCTGRRCFLLPFLTLAGLFGFALGRELLFGSGRLLPGNELLRTGTLGRVSRLDAAFLLVWLAAALFRGCFLVRVLRELLCRPEEQEKGVPE